MLAVATCFVFLEMIDQKLIGIGELKADEDQEEVGVPCLPFLPTSMTTPKPTQTH